MKVFTDNAMECVYLLSKDFFTQNLELKHTTKYVTDLLLFTSTVLFYRPLCMLFLLHMIYYDICALCGKTFEDDERRRSFQVYNQGKK